MGSQDAGLVEAASRTCCLGLCCCCGWPATHSRTPATLHASTDSLHLLQQAQEPTTRLEGSKGCLLNQHASMGSSYVLQQMVQQL